MTFRLTRFVLCGCLVAACGCQNPSSRTANFRDRDTLETRLSFASDDPAPLDRGRGHLPSLASEMADRRHGLRDNASGIPGGSSLTVKRLLERGHDADAHGRTQEARMFYEQVLSEDPDHPEAHHRLGILADQSGDYERAEEHYHTALRGNPTDADVLNDLGYSYFLQGRAAESERYLSQAMQIDPRHPHVQENLSLLYDEAKAEKVLMSVMGPRQTQAALDRLFQNAPGNRTVPNLPTQSQFAHRPAPPNRQANSPAANPAEGDLPDDLQELRRKMEEARLQSIAERNQRNAPQSPPALPDRVTNVPPTPLPSPYPPQSASRRLIGSRDVPDGHINDAFRRIDAGGHSQGVPTRNSNLAVNRASQVRASQFDSPGLPPRTLPPVNAQPITPPTEQRAAAPQWNTPPQPWPYSPESTASQDIEQTRFTQPDFSARQPNARSAGPSAAERAAEIGMSTGPGAMFPQWNPEGETPLQQPQQRPAPAMRSLPGTHSRMNGTLYQQPGGSGVPSNWDNFNSAPETPAHGGQSGLRLENDYSQADYRSPDPPQPNLGRPGNPAEFEAYEQMRAQQNSQFNQDQQSLAASPSLMTNGHPGHEPIPGQFDPNRQVWPAYTRDEYDTRSMNPPPAEPQQSRYGQGQFDGQIMPQIVPATQSAPQDYGRRW